GCYALSLLQVSGERMCFDHQRPEGIVKLVVVRLLGEAAHFVKVTEIVTEPTPDQTGCGIAPLELRQGTEVLSASRQRLSLFEQLTGMRVCYPPVPGEPEDAHACRQAELHRLVCVRNCPEQFAGLLPVANCSRSVSGGHPPTRAPVPTRRLEGITRKLPVLSD